MLKDVLENITTHLDILEQYYLNDDRLTEEIKTMYNLSLMIDRMLLQIMLKWFYDSNISTMAILDELINGKDDSDV